MNMTWNSNADFIKEELCMKIENQWRGTNNLVGSVWQKEKQLRCENASFDGLIYA